MQGRMFVAGTALFALIGCDDPALVPGPPPKPVTVAPGAAPVAPPMVAPPVAPPGTVAPPGSPPVTPAAPLPPPVSDLGSTPEAAITAASNALLRRDAKAFVDCLTPDAQRMFVAFGLRFDISSLRSLEKSMADSKSDVIRQRMKESMDSSSLNQLAKYGITLDDIRALPDDDDKLAFKTALMKLMERIPDPAPLCVQDVSESMARSSKDGSTSLLLGWDPKAQVERLTINGDKASGTIATTSTFNGIPVTTPIPFERINNRWRISLRQRVYFDN